jgi:hypothetical protein
LLRGTGLIEHHRAHALILSGQSGE